MQRARAPDRARPLRPLSTRVTPVWRSASCQWNTPGVMWSSSSRSIRQCRRNTFLKARWYENSARVTVATIDTRRGKRGAAAAVKSRLPTARPRPFVPVAWGIRNRQLGRGGLLGDERAAVALVDPEGPFELAIFAGDQPCPAAAEFTGGRLAESLAKLHNLAEIALDCGFCDQPTFCRQFKDATGMSPSAYRRLALSV